MIHTAVIAGVGPVLGEAVAREFVSQGCCVGLLARSNDVIDDLEAEFRDTEADALAIQADVTDPEQVVDSFNQVRETLGTVDVLIHNASVPSGGSFDDCSPAAFERVWRVRTYGAYLCVKEAVPVMREDASGGTIIFSGTSYAFDGTGEMIDWGSGAFATRGLATSLADGLSSDDIHVAYVGIGAQLAVEETGTLGMNMARAQDVARTYWNLVEQESAQTTELDLRASG